MRHLFNLLLITLALVMFAPAQAADNPNILVMGEYVDQYSIARDSRVFKRVVGALAEQMHTNNFDVFDETAITLDNFAQGRTRRNNAELIDIARSVKRPPIDVVVMFSIYASVHEEKYTTKVKARIEGRLLNVKTGRRLGNFEVDSGQFWNAPANCDRECVLYIIGNKSRILANDLGAVLAEKLAWMVDGGHQHVNMDRPATNDMLSEYSLVFDGFSAEDFSDIEEYLVIFSGYHSHRPVDVRHTRTEIWYKSSIGSAKLNRNIKKLLAELNMRGTINFEGNIFTVKRISLRGKKKQPVVDASW